MVKKIQKAYDTIIVGAGVSGLACANKLHEHNKSFLVLTKDIGGRILPLKENSNINFGAVYMNADYYNTLPLATKIEPFRVRDFSFFSQNSYATLFSVRNWKYYPIILRFLPILYDFRNRLNKMRKLAEHAELREIIENDPVLKKYWYMSVPEFLKQHCFEEIDLVFGQPTCGTNFFTESKQLNVFYYLFLFISMIRPSYVVNLKSLIQKLTESVEKDIVIEGVTKILKKDNQFIIQTRLKRYFANNVVIAAPYKDICKAYAVPKPKHITEVWTYYIIGKRKEKFEISKGIVLHPNSHEAYLLWRQKDGGDLIYAKSGTLNLKKYYDSYTIVKKVFWKTGAHLPNKNIIPQILEKRLYLASDYNFSLVEDAYIMGIFAANSILKNSS